MSLLAKLREKQKRNDATATLATFATQEGTAARSVATVATVASHERGKTAHPAATVATVATVAVANPEKDSPGATANVSRWWRIHYPDRPPLEVLYPSGATRAVVLAAFPDAQQAHPFAPSIRRPSSPLTGEEETLLRRWLAQTGETDPAIIAATIEQCQRDADARHYFIHKRAAVELPQHTKTAG